MGILEWIGIGAIIVVVLAVFLYRRGALSVSLSLDKSASAVADVVSDSARDIAERVKK